ncbi:MAG: hypothetical protein Q9165_000930 [Trypethelium subeluteriae]
MILLTDLPEELLDNIVQHATRSSLKNLRLTSKLFERLASPLIWDRIWISSHALDLEIFKRVTSSRFSKNIRELVWDDTTFQRPLANWKTFVNANLHGHELRRGAKYVPTRDAFEKWFEVASAHHSIRKLALDQETLNEAMPKLVNLKRVVLTNRNVEPIPHEDNVPEFGASPMVRQWKQWSERVPFPPSVCWYDEFRSPNEFVGDLFDTDYLDDALPELGFHGALENSRPFRGLLILLRALNEQKRRTGKLGVKEFIIRPSYEPNTQLEPGISYLFFSRSVFHLTQMANLFEGLRVLNLVISNGKHRSKGAEVVQLGHMTRVLRAARQLEDLTLEMDYLPILYTDPSGVDDNGALHSNYRYEKLRSVSFTNGEFQVEPLLRFLRNHASVLRDVRFYACNLEKHASETIWTSWSRLLFAVKNERLRYRTFFVEDCTDPVGCFYNNSSSTAETFEEYFDGNVHSDHAHGKEQKLSAIPIDVSNEAQNGARFEYYDRYY